MDNVNPQQLTTWIETACLWEASAPKVGNVHPGASFADLAYNDFVRSSRIVAFMLSRISQRGVADSILAAASAVRLQVGKNTSLGIILLIAPLAAARVRGEIAEHISTVIDELDVSASSRICQAIRTSKPGGMGTVEQQDLSAEPTVPVRELMQLAAEKDLIARQYANNFHDLLTLGPDLIEKWMQNSTLDRSQQIVGMQLDWMSRYPDSLIDRKCGSEIALEAQQRAKLILEHGWPTQPETAEELNQFDHWLRAEGNRRNPGTTADFIAAILFLGLANGQLTA
ncbi:MAG: triphosphoribosyl-dephospho-CoA synthase [Planctomycetaceae bacterium]|nr:triphosphoribosyl-dephospho-CoA synthase [Planctomycetaceae bacterium]